MKGTGKLVALPLSYIGRFFTEAARTSKQKEQSVDTMTAPEQQVKKKRCTALGLETFRTTHDANNHRRHECCERMVCIVHEQHVISLNRLMNPGVKVL